MRSLATKLTLAFLVVGLAGAILVAVLVWQSTRMAFEGFIQDREQETLVSFLEQYYSLFGTWAGVRETIHEVSPDLYREPAGGWRRGPDRSLSLFTLIGADKTVIFSSRPDTVGRVYSGRDIEDATPVNVNGETVGWLIRDPVPVELLRNSPEGIFLQRVNRAALISALIAASLALLLGGLLAFTLTRSLRELREATEEIARGNLGQQVKVRSQDELGELAASFNRMSVDLARATEARRQMTADIAHDLRTPLSVIAGYTEALSDGKLPGDDEIYRVLHQETQYLSRLIDDLRLLSLADAGELTLNLQPVQPQSLLEAAAVRHSVAATRRGIELRVEAGADLPSVEADPERLAQVFDNLIANALRHTPSGGEITLSARPESRNGSRESLVRLQVLDSGTGIDPEDLPFIFNRFYRGDKSRSQDGESGLGLAIAKSIVEAHGGTISVESEAGRGAAFIVTLKTK